MNPPRNRKGGSGNPPPKGKRAPALSRPGLATFIRELGLVSTWKAGDHHRALIKSRKGRQRGYLRDPSMLVLSVRLVKAHYFLPPRQSARFLARMPDQLSAGHVEHFVQPIRWQFPAPAASLRS